MNLSIVQQAILMVLFVEPEDSRGWIKYRERTAQEVRRSRTPRAPDRRRLHSKNIVDKDGEILRPCSKCGKCLPLDHYHIDARESGPPGHKSSCKSCNLEQVKEAYHRNPEKPREYARARNETIRRPKLNLTNQIKESRPCADCGRFFPAVCMDFDHRPGTVKLLDVAQIAGGSSGSLEQLDQEIEKCDVVCACCHRLRTSKRPHYRKQAKIKPLA